jgi:hypothetical protein
MRADDVRNLLRVDREVAELRRAVESLRKANQTMASGFARAVMVIPTEAIPAATISGANRVCTHKPAKILDLLIRDANATWTMSEVKPSAGSGPTIKLVNPFTDQVIPADVPIAAVQMAGRSWIPVRGGGGAVIIKTPALGIPARNTSTQVVGRADCVIQTINTSHAIVATSPARSINVCNLSSKPIGGNRYGFATQEETGGRWVITVEDCFP